MKIIQNMISVEAEETDTVTVEEYPYQVEFAYGFKCWVRVEDVDFNICDD